MWRYRPQLTDFVANEKTDQEFRKFVGELKNPDEWFWHDNLKPLVRSIRFGGGVEHLVQIDEKRILAIDGTSFRLLEKNRKGGMKDLWGHQFKLGLRFNFVKTSRNVIASMNPNHEEIKFFGIEGGTIKLIKTIKVRSLVPKLPKSAQNGEIIYFQMPVVSKKHSKRGQICLSYGDSIIKAELTKNLEARNSIKHANTLPYVLATRNPENGDFIFMTKSNEKTSHFRVLNSKLKSKGDDLNFVSSIDERAQNRKLKAGKKHLFIQYTKSFITELPEMRPRMPRESKFREHYPTNYSIYKKGLDGTNSIFYSTPVRSIENEVMLSSLNEKYGFIAYLQQRGGRVSRGYDFLIYSDSAKPLKIKISQQRARIVGRIEDLFRLNHENSVIETSEVERGEKRRLFWLLNSRRKEVKPLVFDGGFEPIDFIELYDSIFLDFDERNERLVLMDFDEWKA